MSTIHDAALDACLSDQCGCRNVFAPLQALKEMDECSESEAGEVVCHNMFAPLQGLKETDECSESETAEVEREPPTVEWYGSPSKLVEAQRRALAPKRYLENRNSPLLSLPRELRDEIWRHVLGDRIITLREKWSWSNEDEEDDYCHAVVGSIYQGPGIYFDRSKPAIVRDPNSPSEPAPCLSSSKSDKEFWSTRRDPFWPSSLGLFSVSRQFREEVEDVFYCKNIFVIMGPGALIRLKHAAKYSRRYPWTGAPIYRIQHMHIVWSREQPRWTRALSIKDPSERYRLDLERMPRLRTLHCSDISSRHMHLVPGGYFTSPRYPLNGHRIDTVKFFRRAEGEEMVRSKVETFFRQSRRASGRHDFDLWLAEWIRSRRE
ncbi:hypothetical protein NA57DRAFT_73175 [Rhizodiscina lignyota]|uniref:Uncharacterized protein n=1 Tax=Rhizodiscina lignyota TaxID=1504668 RepID=A0A9P4IM06_9PEZI|nr:hypothetical protein NA57DRAFT_73175 [Rhizodiscina lignyota]